MHVQGPQSSFSFKKILLTAFQIGSKILPQEKIHINYKRTRVHKIAKEVGTLGVFCQNVT